MDIRTSRVLLVLAIIAIAWISKSHWLPEANETNKGALFQGKEPSQQPLQEYPSKA